MTMNQTQLSVNINKIALLRNSRGENKPNISTFAQTCIALGAHGITVHPRPDQRHITYADVHQLKSELSVELNVEGYPSDDFMDLIATVKPAQVTLVPDPPEALTSSFGWDTKQYQDYLATITHTLHTYGCRVSIFVDPDTIDIPSILATKADRIELYTYNYAKYFPTHPNDAIAPYIRAAELCNAAGIGINAGHDLDQHNLGFLLKHIPTIAEVSIGHALITECLYQGVEHCLSRYLTIISSTHA